MLVGPVVAARMEAQCAVFVQRRNAAITEIRFRESPSPAATWRRAAVLLPAIRSAWAIDVAVSSGSGARQAQEAAGLFDDVMEIEKAAALANDVEQIAMLARGGVGLMFNCT